MDAQQGAGRAGAGDGCSVIRSIPNQVVATTTEDPTSVEPGPPHTALRTLDQAVLWRPRESSSSARHEPTTYSRASTVPERSEGFAGMPEPAGMQSQGGPSDSFASLVAASRDPRSSAPRHACGRDGRRSNGFDFEDGTTEGWGLDYGPGSAANATAWRTAARTRWRSGGMALAGSGAEPRPHWRNPPRERRRNQTVSIRRDPEIRGPLARSRLHFDSAANRNDVVSIDQRLRSGIDMSSIRVFASRLRRGR